MAEQISLNKVVEHLFWLFLLQGLVSLILATLIFIYPETLFILVVSLFIWVGITSIITGFRIRNAGVHINPPPPENLGQ